MLPPVPDVYMYFTDFEGKNQPRIFSAKENQALDRLSYILTARCSGAYRRGSSFVVELPAHVQGLVIS
jgi:hypothetical protein